MSIITGEMFNILRKKISCIDAKILKLLKKRFLLASKIGVLKQKTGSEVVDPNREKEIFAEIERISDKYGLDKSFSKELFELIVQESRKIQG